MHGQRQHAVTRRDDRCKAFDGVVGHVLQQAGIGRERIRGHQQRMAVRGGAGDDLGTDIAAGAGFIVDDDRLVPAPLNFFADGARQDVGTGAGRERHHDGYGAARGLPQGAERNRERG